MFKKYLTKVLLATLIIVSCKNEIVVDESILDGVQVTVAYSMGEVFKHADQMPMICNVAYLTNESMDSTEVLILAPSLKKKSKLKITPIAAMKYVLRNEEKVVIVAIPTSRQLRSIEIADLSELAVNYGYIKRIIEQYYTGSEPMGEIRISNWENQNFVENYISNLSLKNKS